jgi:hypothetical protein
MTYPTRGQATTVTPQDDAEATGRVPGHAREGRVWLTDEVVEAAARAMYNSSRFALSDDRWEMAFPNTQESYRSLVRITLDAAASALEGAILAPALKSLALAIHPEGRRADGTPNLHLAICALAQETIADVLADCGDNSPGVLASNIASRLAGRIEDHLADPDAAVAAHDAAMREEVIDAIEETFLGQLPSKALSYCAQEDVNAGLDALRERFETEGGRS